ELRESSQRGLGHRVHRATRLRHRSRAGHHESARVAPAVRKARGRGSKKISMTTPTPNDSPDAPLVRGALSLDTATVTLAGILPPGFCGPVAKAAQDLFRPLTIQLEPGHYSILLAGTRIHMTGETPRTLRIEQTAALSVGGFVSVWLKTSSAEPAPFCVKLRGHSGRRYYDTRPPMNEEVGNSSVVLGMVAATEDPTP